MPSEEDYINDMFIKLLCDKLKKFHKLTCDRILNPFYDIHMRIDLCKKRNILLPYYIDHILKKLDILKYTLSNTKNIGLCHNDLNPSNIIISKNNLYFIDFEYSAMNDIFWDLASISWFLDFTNRKKLLTEYFGNYKKEYMKKLLDYLYIVKLHNASWSLLKCNNSDSKYDYYKGALMIFEDLLNHNIFIK